MNSYLRMASLGAALLWAAAVLVIAQPAHARVNGVNSGTCPEGTCSRSGTSWANNLKNCSAAHCRSCTDQRNYCIKGVQSRGEGGNWTAECRRAHAACMQSGVWQTYGYFGRTISEMVKK